MPPVDAVLTPQMVLRIASSASEPLSGRRPLGQLPTFELGVSRSRYGSGKRVKVHTNQIKEGFLKSEAKFRKSEIELTTWSRLEIVELLRVGRGLAPRD